MERVEIAEKLLEYLDVPADIKDEAEAKSFFDKNYGKIEVIKETLSKDKDFITKATGQVTGSIQTAIKRVAKELGAEFEEDDLKGKKAEEMLEVAAAKIKEANTKKLTELQKQVGDPSAAQAEWEKEKAKLVGEKSYIEDLYKKQGEEYESYKSTVSQNEKAFKLNMYKDKLYTSIPFPKEADPLKIEGFKSLVERAVTFELEDDKFVVKKEGNPIPNPAKASTFYTPEEYLKEEAVKNGLFTINPDAGRRTTAQPFVSKVEENAPASRPLSGRAMANEL